MASVRDPYAYVPPRVQIQRLHGPRGMLLAPRQITVVKERLPLLAEWRTSSKINRFSKFLFGKACPYGVFEVQGETLLQTKVFVVYNERDFQQDQKNEGQVTLSEGGQGSVKLIQCVVSDKKEMEGEWYAVKTITVNLNLSRDKLLLTYEFISNEHHIQTIQGKSIAPIGVRRSSKNDNVEKIYLLMLLEKGHDLFTLMNRSIEPRNPEHRWPDLMWLIIGIKVLEAVQEMHKKRIIHADLKLENILLSPDNRVSIVDWGFAMLCQQQPVEKFFVTNPCRPGTLHYAAPEIIKDARYSTQSDLYALWLLFDQMFFKQAVMWPADPLLHTPMPYQSTGDLNYTDEEIMALEDIIKPMHHDSHKERPGISDVLGQLREYKESYEIEHPEEAKRTTALLAKREQAEQLRLERIQSMLNPEKSTAIPANSVNAPTAARFFSPAKNATPVNAEPPPISPKIKNYTK